MNCEWKTYILKIKGRNVLFYYFFYLKWQQNFAKANFYIYGPMTCKSSWQQWLGLGDLSPCLIETSIIRKENQALMAKHHSVETQSMYRCSLFFSSIKSLLFCEKRKPFYWYCEEIKLGKLGLKDVTHRGRDENAKQGDETPTTMWSNIVLLCYVRSQLVVVLHWTASLNVIG